MNRLIAILFAFLFAVPIVLAGDCFSDPIYDRDWNGVVTTGMFVRDVACMEGSKILTTVPVGQVVHVIAETDGWYKVETADGIIGWSGQWLLTQTNKPFTPNTPEAPKEPLYDIAGHSYETAIRYLKDNGIIEGYADGSYKPDQTVNRAEFTKIIVEAELGSDPTSFADNCFPDVRSSDWFASYVCYAKKEGIISGYPDGYFRPANTINLVEAAKILVSTLGVERSVVESSLWYREYIEAMQNKSYLPDSFTALDQSVSRAQMAEMVWRIKEDIQGQPFTQFQFMEYEVDESTFSSCADSNLPPAIDMAEVRETWLGWYNDVRTQAGLHPYIYNDYLNNSATVWSEYSSDVGVMSHKRPGQTAYYDYALITQWFADLGITFKNTYGVTYSENIGRGPFSCNGSGCACNTATCTQKLIDAIHTTFDYYMAEKGTSSTAHYDSVMNKYFNEIGLGIALDQSTNQYYLTVHYGTELTSHPVEVCD
jgi:uncharacterized protein YkwD